jgi:hypothetical protein
MWIISTSLSFTTAFLSVPRTRVIFRGRSDEHVRVTALAAAVIGAVPRGEVIHERADMRRLAVEEDSLVGHEDVLEDDHGLAAEDAEPAVADVAAALKLAGVVRLPSEDETHALCVRRHGA